MEKGGVAVALWEKRAVKPLPEYLAWPGRGWDVLEGIGIAGREQALEP